MSKTRHKERNEESARTIDFTEDQIRKVWAKVYGVDSPEALTIKQLFDACVNELTPEGLRKELKCG